MTEKIVGQIHALTFPRKKIRLIRDHLIKDRKLI